MLQLKLNDKVRIKPGIDNDVYAGRTFTVTEELDEFGETYITDDDDGTELAFYDHELELID